MYTELFIRPSPMAEKNIYPDEARKLVGEACDGLSLPFTFAEMVDGQKTETTIEGLKLLFNRNEQGKTISGKFSPDGDPLERGLGKPPTFIFDGGRGFIRIYGMGEKGRALLDQHAGQIAFAIGKHVGGPFQVDIKHGDCTLQTKGARLYSIRRLVASKKPATMGRFIGKSPIEVHNDLATIIYRGLLAQAWWLDENSGQDANKLKPLIPSFNNLDIHIAEGDPVPVPINDKVQAAAYKNLVFSMNATLAGPWYCGHLRTHGYGGIRPCINRR